MSRGLGLRFLVAACLGWLPGGYSQQSEETCKPDHGSRGFALLQVAARNSKSLNLLEVTDMEHLEQYFAARAASGGQLTPTESAAIEQISATIQNVTLPGLNASRVKDMHELELLAGFVATCDATLAYARDGNEGLQTKQNASNASRVVHLQCRSQESKLIEENHTQWLAFKSFHDSLEVPTPALLPAFGSAEIDQFFEENKYAEWLIQHRPRYVYHRDVSKNATVKVEQQAAMCTEAQKAFEDDFCDYADTVHRVANQYKMCRDNASDAFQEALDDVASSTEGRKATYAAVHHIICYIELLHLSSAAQSDKYTECSNMVVDTDFLHITAPELADVVELILPAHTPGDGDWAPSEYGEPPLSDLVGPTQSCHPTTTTTETQATTAVSSTTRAIASTTTGTIASSTTSTSTTTTTTVTTTKTTTTTTTTITSTTTSAGQPLPLINKWVNYKEVYGDAFVTKINGMVILSGLVRNGGWGDIAKLPEGFRPSNEHIFNVNNHENSLRVDVLPDGTVQYVGGAHEHDHISLDGISFAVSAGQPLPLINSWVNLKGAYGDASVKNINGMVILSGLVTHGGWGDIATLPEGFRPSHRLIFSVSQHDNSLRVDVLPDGTVQYVAGTHLQPWISLDGISFAVSAGQPLPLINSWVNYGPVYGDASVKKINGMVILSGLVRNGGWGDIATLPEGFRPSHRLVFSVNNNENSLRVDVLPDGRIQYVAGTHLMIWIPLDGISFALSPSQR